MIQYSYRIESREDFYKWIEDVKNDTKYDEANEVVIKVFTAQISEADMREIHCEIKKTFPKAKIVGISMTNFISEKLIGDKKTLSWTGRFSTSPDTYLMISCCYFYSSKVELIEIDGNDIDDLNGISHDINAKLKSIPNLKGVEVFSSDAKCYVAQFLKIVTKGLEEVPFFGAEAGMTALQNLQVRYHKMLDLENDKNGNTIQYAVGNYYHNEGIVLAAYSGEDLHIKTEYNFGWKPVGKEMKVTETLGNNVLSKIDGVPAIEIYKKYLNVYPNKYLLLNVFDFPFIVNRGGLEASRVASIYDEEGRLYMTGDIKLGEKIRLSYGNPKIILKETWESSERMRKFAPQGITSYVCGARTVFLDADGKREIKDFLRIDPEASGCFGGGEIYCYKGMGGQAATTYLAVGFREGEICSCMEYSKPQEEEVDSKDFIPLANRLAAFLEATTEDLKESKEKFKEAALAAEAANKSKSQFLSNMSHEIRTPINAILGMNEMILRESNDKTIIEYAENIQAAGNTLLGLVNDILDFSKIEAGKTEIIPVEYAFSSLLNDLVNMIQKRADKKGLQFHIRASKDLPSELFGDEIRIKQIVTNILTNAVKYTEHGSVILTVNGTKISEDKIRLYFSVKDTGIGIKPEDIQKLFSAFERIEEKRNRAIEGTGLGMNITQRLLNMMGTSLNVSSVYGEGSEFSFELEQKVLNWHEIGDFEENYRQAIGQHKKYKEKFTAPNAKILVVDDTVMNLTVVKGLLKKTMIQIDTADSGYECLGMVTKNHYDIIFLDHRMPGIDGIETLQRMKILSNNLNQETPVISLTANAISGARKQYIDAGFSDYLTKPIDSTRLEEMIIEYLPPEKVKESSSNENKVPQEFHFEEPPEEENNLPEWLKNVEGLNTENGIIYCGSVEAYLDALTVFARAIVSGAKEIAKFYEQADWKNYTTKVHALKSSARVIGADELSSRAKRLEDAGNAGYINEITESTDGLLELYLSFEKKLSQLIKDEDSDEDKPLIKVSELAEAYETLKEVSASFDYDSVMFVIKSLEDFKLPDAEKEKFEKIKSAAEKPDWETLKNLVA